MIIETSMYDINGTVAVNIPPSLVEYYGLKKQAKPWKCKIEDVSDSQVKITFQKW